MDQKEWERRRDALKARYTMTPGEHAALQAEETPSLRSLQYLLGAAFSYTTSKEIADLNPGDYSDWVNILDTSNPYVFYRMREAAKDAQQRKRAQGSAAAGAEALSHLWDLCATARCAQRAFAASLVPPVIEVEDALQYHLLTMEPPAVVRDSDIVLPTDGFAVSIPNDAINAVYAGRGTDTRVGTHGFVCTDFLGKAPDGEDALRLLLLLPIRRRKEQIASVAVPVFGVSGVPGLDADTSGLVSLVRRYVLNVLLFLGAEDATLKPAHADEIARLEALPSRKKRQFYTKLKLLKKDKTLVLSTTCAINPEIKQFVLEGGLRSPTYTLKHRTLVRGHWRNQVCGEGRKDRKRIAIQAHFRGPRLEEQMGTAVVHTYNVKAPKGG